MKNSKLTLLVSVFAGAWLLIIVITFICNFNNSSISQDGKDWQAFGAYFSGMLSPVLAFINIIVLIALKSTVESFKVNNSDNDYLEFIKRNNQEDDAIQLTKSRSVDYISRDIGNKLDELREVMNDLNKSDETLNEDVKELLLRLNANIAEYEGLSSEQKPFISRNFELVNLKLRNSLNNLEARFLQLMYIIYRDALLNNNQLYLFDRLRKAERRLIKFADQHQLAD